MSFGSGVLVFLGVLLALLVAFLRSGKSTDCEHRMRLVALMEEILAEHQEAAAGLRDRITKLKRGC